MKQLPTKTLPEGYRFSGSVSLKSMKDVTAMLVCSIVLFVLAGLLCFAVLLLFKRGEDTLVAAFSINSIAKLSEVLVGLVLVTLVMVILHEGLHGAVFWLCTREMPMFTFKWYYASASPGNWYLSRFPFLAATLLPLVALTAAGLVGLPFTSGLLRYLLVLLVVFNASGAAGDVLVALRLARLPAGTYSLDKGDEVTFYSPLSSVE